MLAVLDSTRTGVTGSSILQVLLFSESVGLAALSAEDALGLLRLLFITRHFTGSRSVDLARLRANFNMFFFSIDLHCKAHLCLADAA